MFINSYFIKDLLIYQKIKTTLKYLPPTSPPPLKKITKIPIGDIKLTCLIEPWIIWFHNNLRKNVGFLDVDLFNVP